MPNLLILNALRSSLLRHSVLMPMVVLGLSVTSQMAFATKEPYMEEPSNRPICTVNVLKTQNNTHLVEYVYQNAERSKNTTPFWMAGKPLKQDYCKGSQTLYSYAGDDIDAVDQGYIAVWSQAGQKRFEGVYGARGEKVGVWTTYYPNGAIDTKTTYPKNAKAAILTQSWREDGSLRHSLSSDPQIRSLLYTKPIQPQTNTICDVHVLKTENGIHLVEYVFDNKVKNTTPYWTVDTPLQQDYCRDAAFAEGVTDDRFVRRASPFVIWNQQGNKVVDGHYNKFGRREGMWSTYYPSGQMKSTRDTDGKGWYQSWYADGQLQSEVDTGVMGAVGKYWNKGNRSSQPDKTVKTQIFYGRKSTEKIYNKQGKLVASKEWDLSNGSRLVLNKVY